MAKNENGKQPAKNGKQPAKNGKQPAKNGKQPAKNGNGKRPVGRPRALTPDKQDIIFKALEAGSSRKMAARMVGVHFTTITDEAARNPEFANRLGEAEAKCYSYLTNKVAKADDWRAAAFMLERKYPQEFAKAEGRKVDEDKLDRDIEERLAYLDSRREAALSGKAGPGDRANGNGRSNGAK